MFTFVFHAKHFFPFCFLYFDTYRFCIDFIYNTLDFSEKSINDKDIKHKNNIKWLFYKNINKKQ